MVDDLLPAALEALCDPSIAMASVFALASVGKSLVVVGVRGGVGGGGKGGVARAAPQSLWLFDFDCESESASGRAPLSRAKFASNDDPVAVALREGSVQGVFVGGESRAIVFCGGALYAIAIPEATGTGKAWSSSLVTKAPAGVVEMCVETTADGSTLAVCLCEGESGEDEIEVYPPPPSFLSLLVFSSEAGAEAGTEAGTEAGAGAAAGEEKGKGKGKGETVWRCACSRVPKPAEGLVVCGERSLAVFRVLLGV